MTARRLLDAASVVALVIVTAIVGLFAWTLLPMAGGWKPTVVLTGSMSPQIQPGDVVVIAPIPSSGLRPGYVIRFHDPAQPDRYLVHRIARIDSSGHITTKGDANATEDSTPLAATDVLGVARLRVPAIGKPVIYLREHRYVPFGAVVGGFMILLVLAQRSLNGVVTGPVRGRHRLRRRSGAYRPRAVS